MSVVKGGPAPELRDEWVAYDESRFLDCYTLLRHKGELEQSNLSERYFLWARVIGHLGAEARWLRLLAKARQQRPSHPEAQLHYARLLLGWRGASAALRYLETHAEPLASLPPRHQRQLCGLRLSAWLALRDGEQAEAELTRLTRAGEGELELVVWRSRLLAREDRFEEALGVLLPHTEARPASHGLVLAAARLSCSLRSLEEALALVERTWGRFQCWALPALAASACRDLGHLEQERIWLERWEHFSPLRDRPLSQQLAGRWSDHFYARGDSARAKREADRAGPGFFERLSRNLQQRAQVQGERVQLDVPPVAQHHNTCSPATLAMLSGYFGRPAQQVEVADQICYEGTAARSERAWAAANGWVCREFTLTEGTAHELLRRGVPFAAVTVESESAHIQVVCGFDTCRGTLLLRDPSSAFLCEVLTAELLERYETYGPRALVLVRPEEEAKLSGLHFLGATHYDRAFEVAQLLEQHRRQAAGEALAQLQAQACPPYLRWSSEWALANYDRNTDRTLRCTQRFLEERPGEIRANLLLASCLAEVAGPERSIAHLEACMAAAAEKRPYQEPLASASLGDARRHDKARRLLHRALRAGPRASAFDLLARMELLSGNREEALRYRRLVACLEPTQDEGARAYFDAAFECGKAESSLSFLRHRTARWGARSAEPWIVYTEALERLDRQGRARQALALAFEARPGDGRLLTWAAEFHARLGEFDRAESLLKEAQPATAEAEFLSARRAVSEASGEPAGALSAARRLSKLQPGVVAHHATVCRLLERLEGPARADEYLQQLCRHHPEHFGFRRLCVEQGREGRDPERYLAHLEQLLESAPKDAWALRELALAHLGSGDLTRSQKVYESAAELQPEAPAVLYLRGKLAEARGDRAEAREALLSAIQRAPDAVPYLSSYLDLEPLGPARAQLLRDVWEIISLRAVEFESTLLAAQCACTVWPEAEALRALEHNTRSRPRHWGTWQAWARALQDRGHTSKAVTVAQTLTSLFPHTPGSWLTLSYAASESGDLEQAEGAARRAVQLQPAFTPAVCQLVDLLRRNTERAGSREAGLQQALEALDEALRAAPSSSSLLRLRAELRQLSGLSAPALDDLRRAVELSPSDSELWEELARYCRLLQREQPERSEYFQNLPQMWASELAAKLPWEPEIWQALANAQFELGQMRQAQQSVERYLQHCPREVNALDLLAQVGVALYDRARALECCSRGVAPADQPVLEARRAWVLYSLGDREEGMAAMRAAARRHPKRAWPWQCLADWAEEAGQTKEAVEAAERLLELSPNGAVAHAYLAAALLAEGAQEPSPSARTEERAAKHFRRALELSPGYEYALNQLWLLADSRKRLELFEGVLSRSYAYLSAPRRVLWSFREVLLEGDSRSITAKAYELGRLVELEAVDLTSAFDAWARHSAGDATRAVAGWLADPAIHPELGGWWLRRHYDAHSPSVAKIFELLERNPKLSEPVLREYFEALGDSGPRSRVKAAYKGLAASARPHTAAWGKVGFALLNHRMLDDCIQWLQDYRARQFEPWMLFNLTSALADRGLLSEARVVSEAALEAAPDDCSPRHAAYAGLLCALEGDRERAQSYASAPGQSELSARDCWPAGALKLILPEANSPRQARLKADSELFNYRVLFKCLNPGGGALQRAVGRHVARGTPWAARAQVAAHAPALWIFLWLAAAAAFRSPAILLGLGFYVAQCIGASTRRRGVRQRSPEPGRPLERVLETPSGRAPPPTEAPPREAPRLAGGVEKASS